MNCGRTTETNFTDAIIVLHCLKDNSWHVPSGLADRTEGIIKWMGSEWVEDTLDGGIGLWLGPTSNSQPKRWLRNGYEGTLVKDGEITSLPASKLKVCEEEDTLKASCHCGGVKFHITRPNVASEEDVKAVRSPFSDSIIPFHEGGKEAAANPDNEQWWLCADGTKYFASLCKSYSHRADSPSQYSEELWEETFLTFLKK